MSPEGSGEPQRAEPVRAVCLAVEGFYPMGGTERQVVEIAVELHRRAIPVTVLCRWPVPVDNRYAEELRQAGVRVIASGWTDAPGGRLRRLPYLWARLRGGWRDPHQTERQLWRWQAAKVRRLRGAGLVLHEVPYGGLLSRPGRQTLTAIDIPLVVTVFGGLHAPTLDLPGAVITADGAPTINPPGTNYTWVPSIGHRALATLQPDHRRPRSGMVVYGGRLVPEKDVDSLLRAMTLLPEGLELVIAGDGVERPRLERLAGALRIRARFLGAIEPTELFELLRRCDVAAFPGLQDGLPSFIVEALGAGLPVVGTDVGGIPRALEGSGGLVVPPGSPGAMADGIGRLIGGDLPRLRRLARRAYEERFTPARVVDRYLECYAEALDRSRDRAREPGAPARA
jgi:glycosyltransferase involved in cell wall biosynthesis